MRVLRITPLWDWRAHASPPPLTDPAECIGGHAAQAVRLTLAVADAGVDQEIVAPRAAGAPARHELRPGVPVRGVGPAGLRGVHRRNVAWLAGVLGDLPARRGRFDVVHVHASGFVEPLWAALAARAALRVPLVVTLHHSSQATYVPQSRRDAAVQVATRAAERAVIRRGALTYALTDRVAARLGTGGAVTALPDCLDVAAFQASATPAAGQAFRGRFGIPAEAPLALFVGRLSEEKGWRDLPGLAAAVDGLHVAVCGDGEGHDELARAGGPRMHLAGAVETDVVAAAMAAADVLVLPSRFEELGSVLVEAMAAGLPSVAYDVGGVAEAVEPGVTGTLVVGGDTRALAEAVRATLADAGLQERAAAEGPRIARARYDQAAHGARLRADYERVA